MKTVWSIIAGIVALIVLCLVCIGTLYVLGLQGGTSVRLEYQANVPTATATPMATQVVREEICEYAGGTTDAGIKLQTGSTVIGPAIVQLNATQIKVLYPGATYPAPAGSVVWLYKGNVQCLLAQLEFFPSQDIEKIGFPIEEIR